MIPTSLVRHRGEKTATGWRCRHCKPKANKRLGTWNSNAYRWCRKCGRNR